ncbi:ATP synthase F1 subunit epsilon [bacterium (candidate division B38) B3_B38]|nr:MAG: ATP synthase F1 subunit epsilon [bacterium (candidate division B38) B3_B38]
MGAEKITLEVVTPEKLVVGEDVDEITAPGYYGYFGVLPHHHPYLTLIGIGELMYRIGDKSHYLAVSKGFAEVLGNKVTFLVESCEKPQEIDVSRAEKAKERAEARLRAPTPELNVERASASLQRALTRLKVEKRKGQA